MGRIFLVRFSDNWADEMDLEGWYVVHASDENELKQNLVPLKTKFPKTISFGTNQYNEYIDREHLLAQYSWEDITYEESQVLDKLFGGSDGVWPDLTDYYDDEYDNEDNDE